MHQICNICVHNSDAHIPAQQQYTPARLQIRTNLLSVNMDSCCPDRHRLSKEQRPPAAAAAAAAAAAGAEQQRPLRCLW